MSSRFLFFLFEGVCGPRLLGASVVHEIMSCLVLGARAYVWSCWRGLLPPASPPPPLSPSPRPPPPRPPPVAPAPAERPVPAPRRVVEYRWDFRVFVLVLTGDIWSLVYLPAAQRPLPPPHLAWLLRCGKWTRKLTERMHRKACVEV